jgi:hypothetical protein
LITAFRSVWGSVASVIYAAILKKQSIPAISDPTLQVRLENPVLPLTLLQGQLKQLQLAIPQVLT